MVDPADPSLCSNEHAPARVALAHDWIVARRGGEQVLEAIVAALAPDAEPAGLWTLFHTGVGVGPGVDALPVHTSALNALPPGLRRWLLPAYPAGVASLSRSLDACHRRDRIDLLISTSSSAIKSIRSPPGVPHVCYCHTPARYLWSQTDAYTLGGLKGALRGAGLGVFRDALRDWDRDTADRVDLFVANSTHTREQIRAAYGRDATVLHPPVRTDFFTPDPTVAREGFALIVSALEPYKRVDLAIEACALARTELVVVGRGSHEPALRALASGTAHARVRFAPDLDDAGVRDAMRRARVFLMPQIEDFGITAVEAQACGTPVLARAAGGAMDTVLDGRTGRLLRRLTPPDLAEALSSMPAPDPIACRAHAERFGVDRFTHGIRGVIRAVLSQTGTTPRPSAARTY